MKHTILIGFKNVGKTTIGKELSLKTNKIFIDLDQKIEENWQIEHGSVKNCREIMKEHGEKFFRELEHQVLKKVLAGETPSIISLGGGTPMLRENQELLQGHLVIHITAPSNIVFERIMVGGKPAFFPDDTDPLAFFKDLWQEREKVYAELADVTVENDGTVDNVVGKIVILLHC